MPLKNLLHLSRIVLVASNEANRMPSAFFYTTIRSRRRLLDDICSQFHYFIFKHVRIYIRKIVYQYKAT